MESRTPNPRTAAAEDSKKAGDLLPFLVELKL
jgi:hypothetical protein